MPTSGSTSEDTRPLAGRARQILGGGWRTEWIVLTLLATLVASAIDAIILQQSRSFFTGGFLVEDHLEGGGHAVAFLAGALLVDAGLVGMTSALALAVAARLGASAAARRLAGFVAGVAPLAMSSLVAYRVFEFLGGAFDIGLMFDLAGRRPEEFLAVASEHVLFPALMTGAGALAVGLLLRLVHRRWPAGAWEPVARPKLREWLKASGTLALAGLIVSTAMRLGSDAFDNGLRRKPSGRAYGSVVAVLSDVDFDGSGLFGRPADPAPLDGRAYPYAVDWPGNGVDENGVAGDLPAGTTPWSEPSGEPPVFAHKPDVVLVVLESFRGDLVGATVDGKAVTPVLDDLARRGLSSSFAYSHNGYTVQSRFHQFSGSIAGLRGRTTLVDDFAANGYEVAYFSAQDESFGTDGPYDIGFGRAHLAYDARQDRSRRYTTFTTPGSLAVPARVLLDRIRELLQRRSPARPLFLYVNFHDTHFPYWHEGVVPIVSDLHLPQADIGPGRRDDLWRTYANTAANVDRAVGELLRDVTQAVGREPVVIVTADHGESLYDEGFLGHGYALTDVQTRIPFIVANLPMRVREPVGQSDLRDALRQALARDPGPPEVDPQEGPPVFQYLGSIDRPRQVAFTSKRWRVVYDFRTGRFQNAGGDWVRPQDLNGQDHAVFLDLVRTWERMRLARARREASR